ncbi:MULTISPECIES: hypothetical protein [unclassified Moraxella]|uniref:hypothetical protein n=1 Tax=unclassified Moraxella TaxID=2685852 RepID=UPI002B403FF0|nr:MULTISPECIES: hypothetical protein [unclassified Moraxella]
MNIKNIFKAILISYDKWIFIIAMLFGVITSYTYLKFIDKLSLFSDIVNNFSILVAISVVYCILAFLIGICFIFPLLISFLIKSFYNNHQLSIKFLILQVVFLIVGFLPYFLIPFFSLNLYYLWFLLGSAILIFLCNIITIKNPDHKNSHSMDMIILIFAITIFQHYPIILSIYPISDFSNKSLDEWVLFLLIPSINILMYLISFVVIAVSPKTNVKIKNIFLIMFGVFSASYFLLFSIKGNAPYQSLYAVRFIEKTKNASWYLIHNGNTNSNTVNGLNQTDIIQAKEIFNAKDCTGLNGEFKTKCENDNQQIFNQRQNALYGYMAWNLGNTKVFCPVSVDFFKADNQDKRNEMSKKCLVIDGKYLQLISEHYLN